LEKIVDADYARVTLIIKYPGHFKRHVRTTLYEKLDRAIFRMPTDYTTGKNIQPLLGSVPAIEVVFPEKTAEKIPDDTRLKIKEATLDVILQLGDFAVSDGLSSLAKYGVWVTRFYDPRAIKTVKPVYWEFFKKMGETGSVIQRITENRDRPVTLYRAWELMNHYSLNLNRNRIFSRTSLFIPRILNGIYNQG